MEDWIGFVCAAIAVFFFGSNFIPVKKYETGDGMFFQFILSTGIWMTGLVCYLILELPAMSWRAMLGGFVWCTGNLATVPIIQAIGLAMGLLIWGSSNMLTGWLSGVVGFFGIKKQTAEIKTFWLNIVGMILCLVSVGVSLFVKTETGGEEEKKQHGLKSVGSFGVMSTATDQPLIDDGVTTYKHDALPDSSHLIDGREKSWIERMNPTKKRIIGIAMALCAGVCYGINFTPAQVDYEKYPGKWTKTIDLAFSLFCGVYASSTIYFVGYCILNKEPKLYPKAIIPGLISGCMWAIADLCWFVANDALSYALSFPIIVPGPSIVSSCWGLFYFHEIKGKRNYLFLGLTFLFMFIGVALIVVSRYVKI